MGKSVLNVFNGIGEMYDNLEKVIDIYEFRLAKRLYTNSR